MTKFVVLTLFKEMFTSFINTSIIGRSIKKGIVDIELIDIRNFSNDKNRKVDDTPCGGGNGMIIAVDVLDRAIKNAISHFEKNDNIKIYYMSPRGKLLNYNVVNNISKNYESYILICGHYEGIDERIITKYNIEEISIGDYVLTGGEIPAMVLMDSVIRLKSGVLKEGSLENESHTNTLLEYPQYTRPISYEGLEVPEVLLSGNHEKIAEYRENESIYITYKNRIDLIDKLLKEGKISKKKLEKIVNEKGGK